MKNLQKTMSAVLCAALTAASIVPVYAEDETVDKSVLQFYLNKAEANTFSDSIFYDSSDWSAYLTALENAKAVNSDDAATADSVTAAKDALKTAYYKLKADKLTGKVLSDNAFNGAPDTAYYAQYGIDISKKIETGANYSWESDANNEILTSERYVTDENGNAVTNERGLNLGKDLTNGNVTNGAGEYNVNSAWANGWNAMTSTMTFDLKDSYWVSGVDIVSRYNGGNQLGDVSIKVGNDIENMTETAAAAGETFTTDISENSFHSTYISFEPANGRYVSVTFNNALYDKGQKTYGGGQSYQYAIAEVVVFGDTKALNTSVYDEYMAAARSKLNSGALYSDETIDALEAAYNEGLAAADTTQAAINSAAAKLKAAIDALEFKDPLAIVSNNAITQIDIDYYKNNMGGMELKKIETGASYTWLEGSNSDLVNTDTDNDGQEMIGGQFTNNSGPQAANTGWTAGLMPSTALFDLKDAYYISRLDVFSRVSKANQLGEIVIKAGDNPDEMTIIAETTGVVPNEPKDNTIYPTVTEFSPVSARYVSISFKNAKTTYSGGTSWQYCLGEIVIFGRKAVIPRNDLADKISEAQTLLSEDNYSEASTNALRTALEAAQATYANENAGYSEVRAAIKSLTNAIEALEEKPLSVLTKKIAAAKEYINNDDYSKTSRENLNVKTTAAEELLASGTAGEEELKAAAAAIDAAIAELAESPKKELKVRIAKAKTYSEESNYSASSWAVLSEKLAAAEAVLADAQAEDKAVSAATKALNSAMSTLEENPKITLAALIEELNGYTDLFPYTDESRAAFNTAKEEAQSVYANENADETTLKAACESLADAISLLTLRGGNKLLSQNTMWESDWQTTGYVKKNVLQERISGTSLTVSGDQGLVNSGTNKLLGGGLMNSAGEYCAFATWDDGRQSEGTAEYIYDLGGVYYINGVDLASRFIYTSESEKRLLKEYKVDISTDGENYTEVGTKYPRTTLKNGEDYTDGGGYPMFTEYSFNAQKARYVKITTKKCVGYTYILHELFVRGGIVNENKINIEKTADGVHAEAVLNGSESSAQMAIAVYGSDGKLSGITLGEKKTMTDGKTVVSADAKVDIGGYAKAMTFDSIDGMKPIIDYATSARFVNTEFTVSDMFGDHAVLQRDQSLPIFGKATTGTEITATIDGKNYTATADENGDWICYADPISLSAGAYTLSVTDGETTYTYSDLLAGDVWLFSGQSNMWWRVKWCLNADANIRDADNYPNIRYYQVPVCGAETPQDKVSDLHDNDEIGKGWKVSSSEIANNFSALAFMTARNLNKELNVPIGVIEAARGGTGIEGFISREGFANSNVERYYSYLDRSLYFNGMINPVIPYGIKGAFWYQGCNNHQPNNNIYLDEELAMLKDWRTRWGNDFYFILSELAAHSGGSGFPAIRQAQLELRDRAENVGVVSIMDVIPDTPTNIHPVNKQPVADRFALCAQGMAYGKNVEYLFPAPESCAINDDGSVTVTFKDVYGGLKADGDVTGFELVQGGNVYSAAGQITSANTIKVSAAGVTAPTQIRYCYKPYPEKVLNLFNSADLSATPFIMDLN